MVEGAKDRRTAQKQHPMLWWKRKKKGRMRHNQPKQEEERDKGISLQNKISKQVHRHPPSAEDIEMVAMLETLQARRLHPRPARRQFLLFLLSTTTVKGAAQHNAALIGGVEE